MATSFDGSPLMTGNPDDDNRMALAMTLQGEFGGVQDANTRRELMKMAAGAAMNTFGKAEWSKNYGDFKAHLDDRFMAPRDGVSGKNQMAREALTGQITAEDEAKDALQIASATMAGRLGTDWHAQYYFTPEEISQMKKNKSFDFSQMESKGKLDKYELFSYKPEVWKKKVETSDANIDLQSKLATLGLYQGKVDGMVGKHTKEAVKSFQRAVGLAEDGVAGKKTKAKLEELYQQLAKQ